MSERGPIIQVERLHRHFSMGTEVVKALNGVSLTVFPGEFFGVMGASGSGKSTLLYVLGGLDRPTSGRIIVAGQEVSTLDENDLAAYRRHTVGFVYQMFHLVPTMTALQNVEFPMIIARVPSGERRRRAQELLGLMGLGDRLRHRPTELSGGQRQRVAIARALANNPAIILADEPTGNLDSRAGADVVALLKGLTREGRTVVIVSHDPDVIAQTDRYIRLHDGEIVEEERP